ncbi:discoidin domain-containing protein, partial [Acetobacter malorum]|uniref:discoidin domain-containing protein n=1 Tax=Acetobacter malorum TaxID=178901 RepID=UPI00248D8420
IYPDYAFHTEFQKNPWWMVEFKNIESIKAICIYNRRDDLNCSFRIFPLVIEISNNGVDFEEISQIQETSETVSILKTHNVFLMNFPEGLNCKFLRLIVKKDHEALHLRKVDIYV